MKNLLTSFALGCVVAGAGALVVIHDKGEQVAQQQQELDGYTRYTDFLAVGQQSLQAQAKFLAATVLRQETLTREIKRKRFVFRSDATVLIHYTAEYSIGYDLSPGSYEVKDTVTGIEIAMKKKPALVASPAMKQKSHQIPSTGWLIDEREALLELYEGMDPLLAQQGQKVAAEEAVIALCEKKLIAFFSDFLSRQPGVKRVPAIHIRYTEASRS